MYTYVPWLSIHFAALCLYNDASTGTHLRMRGSFSHVDVSLSKLCWVGTLYSSFVVRMWFCGPFNSTGVEVGCTFVGGVS